MPTKRGPASKKRKPKPPVIVVAPPIPPTVAIVTHERFLFGSPTHREDEVCPLCDDEATMYRRAAFRMRWPSGEALRMIRRRMP